MRVRAAFNALVRTRFPTQTTPNRVVGPFRVRDRHETTARASVDAPKLHAEVRGVDAVAQVFAGGARAARLCLVDGLAGAVVALRGRPMAVFAFAVRDSLVVGIDLVSDPETLRALDLMPLPRSGVAGIAVNPTGESEPPPPPP